MFWRSPTACDSRASRIAKLAPGETVPVIVIGRVSPQRSCQFPVCKGTEYEHKRNEGGVIRCSPQSCLKRFPRCGPVNWWLRLASCVPTSTGAAFGTPPTQEFLGGRVAIPPQLRGCGCQSGKGANQRLKLARNCPILARSREKTGELGRRCCCRPSSLPQMRCQTATEPCGSLWQRTIASSEKRNMNSPRGSAHPACAAESPASCAHGFPCGFSSNRGEKGISAGRSIAELSDAMAGGPGKRLGLRPRRPAKRSSGRNPRERRGVGGARVPLTSPGRTRYANRYFAVRTVSLRLRPSYPVPLSYRPGAARASAKADCAHCEISVCIASSSGACQRHSRAPYASSFSRIAAARSLRGSART